MEPTTPSSSRWRGPRVLVVGLAAVAIALAVPRLIAGLVAMPYDPLPDAAGDPERLSWLGRASAAFETASAWHDDARYWDLLAEARYRVAARRTQASAQRAGLQAAMAAQRASLARRPVDPHAWTRLATALLRLEGNTADFRTAYRQAVATGANVPALLAPRATLGLVADFDLTSDLSVMAERQLELAARHVPQRLARAVASPALRRLALDRLPPGPRCRAAVAFAGRADFSGCPG